MWIEGQPTLSLCISNKMEACWALHNRFPPLHLCLSTMVNHSLGRKSNVLFMPSFELKCFSLCYINTYITPSNTVIDRVRSLWEHIPCSNGKGRTLQGTPAAGEELLPQCRDTDTAPDLLPFLELPWDLHRGPKSWTKAVTTGEHCKRSLHGCPVIFHLGQLYFAECTGKHRALLQPEPSRCCREARKPRAPGCWEQGQSSCWLQKEYEWA